jgi:phenylpyruvate tautomerase PptA (4-oxalocrotonate tautomerase family)
VVTISNAAVFLKGKNMPLYQIMNPKGAFTRETKQQIAAGISEIHLARAGGLKAFINVIFNEYEAGDGYIAAEEDSPVIVSGSVRAGRDQQQKTDIMNDIMALMTQTGGIGVKKLVIAISDVNPANAMEWGHIMPEVGQEQEWLAKVTPLLNHD